MTRINTVTTPGAVLGAVLIKLRKERGVKQATLAAAAGIGPSTWSRIENGESGLSIAQLRRVSNLLCIESGTVLQMAEDAEKKALQHGIDAHHFQIPSFLLGKKAIKNAALESIVGEASTSSLGPIIHLCGSALSNILEKIEVPTRARVVQELVKDYLYYKNGVAFCNCPVEYTNDVVREILTTTSNTQFLLFEERFSERRYWVYGFTTEWIKEHFAYASSVCQEGEILTFFTQTDLSWMPGFDERKNENLSMKNRAISLEIGGVKISNIAKFKEHFSGEVLSLFRSGCLSKWLVSQGLLAEFDAISAINKNCSSHSQLKAICRIFGFAYSGEIMEAFVFFDDLHTKRPELRSRPFDVNSVVNLT